MQKQTSSLSLALMATILASSMGFIDGTVVNVALPVLQHSLKTTSTNIIWVVEAYSLFLSSLILVGGALGDKFGRKKVFVIGILLFSLASVCCGLSSSVWTLIFFRSLQGIGGALLVPGSLSIITAIFPDNERGKAIGTWSAFSAITTALGPVIGGILVQHISWRAAFFINIPIALVAIILTLIAIPETKQEESTAPIDYIGALLATTGLGGLVYSLIQMQLHTVSIAYLLAFALGISILVGFVIYERRAKYPMISFTLFTSKVFTGANLLTFLLYGALGGALYYLPFNVIQVQGFSPTEAGAMFLPFSVLLFSLSRWIGHLSSKFGSKPFLIVGPSFVGIAFLLFMRPSLHAMYWNSFFPAIVVMGLGMAITVAPLTNAVMGAAGKEHAGIGSGINNAVSRAAGLISIAFLGILLLHTFSSQLQQHITSLSLKDQTYIISQEGKLADITIPQDLSVHNTYVISQDIKKSFVFGFRVVMFTGAVMAILSALLAAIFL